MNKSLVLTTVLMLASPLLHADEVLSVEKDRVVGGGFGGLGGFMVGAAAGGPIGALVGGALGYFAGQGVQEAAGLDHSLYLIKDDKGHVTRLRTSATGFVPGEQVERDGARIVAASR